MTRPTVAWRAWKTMTKRVKDDPKWAVVNVLTSPFRMVFFLGEFAFRFGIIALPAYFGIPFFLEPTSPYWMPSITVSILALVYVTYDFITQPLVMYFGYVKDDTHGTARFASAKELTEFTEQGSGLLIGRNDKTDELLRYDGPAHLITMAPTRTGKGVGTIIPNLLTADRSIVCIDPKGENAGVARHARDLFGPVHVLDPFEITTTSSACYNPLDRLDPFGLDVAEDASALADALVHDEPGMSGDAHWNEEAKALIAGMILYVISKEPEDRRNLTTLRECLTLAPANFQALLLKMQSATEAGGLIARASNRHLGKSDREAAGVLSSAQRHTHFLDSPRMAKVLSASDFSFADLKNYTATVFLVLPPDRLSTYSRWLRLLISQSLTDMIRNPTQPDQPVLYLLDEFAALGHLAPVERAMGLMAGYGVQLWPILQDIHQLQATYGGRAGTFLSNAGVMQVFGINDHESARLVSNLLGEETVTFYSSGHGIGFGFDSVNLSEQHTQRALLTPDEVRNLPSDTQLLFIAGRRPIRAKKLQYFKDPEFNGLYDNY